MYFYVKIPGTDITGHVNDDASFSIMSNISFLWHIECAAECIYSIYFTVNKWNICIMMAAYFLDYITKEIRLFCTDRMMHSNVTLFILISSIKWNNSESNKVVNVCQQLEVPPQPKQYATVAIPSSSLISHMAHFLLQFKQPGCSRSHWTVKALINMRCANIALQVLCFGGILHLYSSPLGYRVFSFYIQGFLLRNTDWEALCCRRRYNSFFFESPVDSEASEHFQTSQKTKYFLMCCFKMCLSCWKLKIQFNELAFFSNSCLCRTQSVQWEISFSNHYAEWVLKRSATNGSHFILRR